MVSGLSRDLLIGLALIGVVVLALGVIVGLIFLLWKFLGIGLVLLGIFMIIFFPDVTDYQRSSVSWAGVFLGFIFIAAGIIILII